MFTLAIIEHQLYLVVEGFCDLVIKECEQNPDLYEELHFVPGLSHDLINEILNKKVGNLGIINMITIAVYCDIDLVELFDSFI